MPSANPAIARRIAAVKENHAVDYATLAREAIALAADLLEESLKHLTSKDRAQAAKMARMMDDPNGKALTLALADQVFRAHEPARIASQFSHLVRGYGVARYLTPRERLLMRTAATAAPHFPRIIMPAVTENLREQSAQVILPSEPARLKTHLEKRRASGTRLNLNQLGEAILGEDEAQRRLDANLRLLAYPNIEYISVKISSIFSQLNTLAFEDTVCEIQKRLRTLYRAAQQHTFTRADGTASPKFVNLDMEEYRDLHLTAEAFKRTLTEPEFLKLKAGIVLQAYLPDSFNVQRELTEWIGARVAAGGAPIKIRIVKGANLAMERIDAATHGWPQAPYSTKPDVDANYKRMLHYGTLPENAAHVQLGIASHNLFDLAYALLLRSARNVENFIELEMLEGMANHQAAAVQDAAHGLLLYAPIVSKNDFHSAIAYLVRRLDENTSEENFLHDLFNLEVGSHNWEKQSAWFLDAVRRAEGSSGTGDSPVGSGSTQPSGFQPFSPSALSSTPNRTQNRATEKPAPPLDQPFANEPDTDWTLPANRTWLTAAIEKLRAASPEKIPLQIGGEFIFPDADSPASHATSATGSDPARPGETAYTYTLANAHHVEAAIAHAQRALPEWSARPVDERRAILMRCAAALAQHRDTLITAALIDGGKAAHESDPEISEAIDFANYYARAYDDAPTATPGAFEGVTPAPLGVITIAPPWNFPIAIPCGGALAALMAGNTVIFKPSSDTVLCGWRLLQILWDAGVPKNALQFVTPAREAATQLITDPRVAGVVLTGASSTAEKFLNLRPDLRLFAETGGKNAMIVTANADHDQAIKDIVKSAFGHGGQKCSATSLLILEAEVYDSPTFAKQLRDAAASLRVGSAWNTAHVMTALIHAPDATLQRALTTLDDGEEWLLAPRQLDGNPSLWTPGIKRGVKPGSWFHHTECFGPVLGIMRADNLAHAIELANSVSYGLTTGLHTLDDREIAVWRNRIEAGNLYINRGTTGAIVRRQPFGGWKASVYGPGANAGGPNYVAQFSHWRQTALPQTTAGLTPEIQTLLEKLRTWLGASDATNNTAATDALLTTAAGNYAHALKTHFSLEHDPSQILGEHNHFRYRLQPGVLIRATSDTTKTDLALALLAASTVGIRTTLSLPEALKCAHTFAFSLPGDITLVTETEETLAARLTNKTPPPIETVFRPLGAVSENLLRATNAAHMAYIPGKPTANGRLELRAFCREQTISHSYHRYGNIIARPA